MEEHLNLLDTFSEFKEFKNIERESLMRILEDIFRHTLIKKFGPDANFDVIVNVDRGDLEIQRYREIVEDGDVRDENTQIALSEAIKIEPDFEVGEEVSEKIQLKDFARREILSLRQNLVSKIMEYEKDLIFKKYEKKIGELINGEVNQVWKKEILISDEDGVELVLPKEEQIPGDYYKKGDSILVVVVNVTVKGTSPVIKVSRNSPVFLERLMETEIPEIYDGLITIKNIVRAPGERAKVVVETYDDRIDPVGACVGVKGSRIHGITKELRNENIDIINYTSNLNLLIQRALSPAKISSIQIDEATKTANVFMKSDQVSLAIGKGGYNIKLAGKLIGYEIDVFREDLQNDEEDVDLKEFADEIDMWIIKQLEDIGCFTAKSVLALSPQEIANRADLEEETVADVLRILKSEFED